MERSYKLAANFNVVEITNIKREDLLKFVDWNIDYVDGMEECDFDVNCIPEEILLGRLLQKEYDILAGIKTVAPAAAPARKAAAEEKQEAPVEKASPRQIAYAKSLGMKNADKASKQIVWKYIQEHKD